MTLFYGLLAIICFMCIGSYKGLKDQVSCIASFCFFSVWCIFHLFDYPDLTPDWSMSINWGMNFILFTALVALNARYLLKLVCFIGLILHTFGYFIAIVDRLEYAVVYNQSTFILSILFTLLLVALSDAGNRTYRYNQARAYAVRHLSRLGKA